MWAFSFLDSNCRGQGLSGLVSAAVPGSVDSGVASAAMGDPCVYLHVYILASCAAVVAANRSRAQSVPGRPSNSIHSFSSGPRHFSYPVDRPRMVALAPYPRG